MVKLVAKGMLILILVSQCFVHSVDPSCLVDVSFFFPFFALDTLEVGGYISLLYVLYSVP